MQAASAEAASNAADVANSYDDDETTKWVSKPGEGTTFTIVMPGEMIKRRKTETNGHVVVEDLAPAAHAAGNALCGEQSLEDIFLELTGGTDVDDMVKELDDVG